MWEQSINLKLQSLLKVHQWKTIKILEIHIIIMKLSDSITPVNVNMPKKQ